MVKLSGRAQRAGDAWHWQDKFNAISAESVLMAQFNGDACASMPPGSHLVLDVINPYRRALDADGAKRFPFIDLLPSEMAVVYALLYLDPQLAMRRISTALGIGAKAWARSFGMFLRPSRLLTTPPSAEPGVLDESGPVANQQAMADLAQGLVNCMQDDERDPANSEMIQKYVVDYLAEGASAPANGMLSATSDWVRRLLLRGLGKELEKARSAFDAATPDELARHSIEVWGHHSSGPVIAITSHTHASKWIEHTHGVYLNSGTWQDLVQPPQDTSEKAVAAWLLALQADQIPRWRRCPVVRVDADGAALLNWDGNRLQNW